MIKNKITFSLNFLVSFLSVLSHKHEEKRKSLPPSIWKEPKDDFHLVHITMFLLGFMSLMPMTFFSVANDVSLCTLF